MLSFKIWLWLKCVFNTISHDFRTSLQKVLVQLFKRFSIKASPKSKNPDTISPNTALKILNQDCPPCTSLCIQEHFKEIIKLFKFTIFKPPAKRFCVTTERLILSHLDFQINLKKSLFKKIIVSILGFGNEISKWFIFGIIRLLSTVSLPMGVRIRLSHCWMSADFSEFEYYNLILEFVPSQHKNEYLIIQIQWLLNLISI